MLSINVFISNSALLGDKLKSGLLERWFIHITLHTHICLIYIELFGYFSQMPNNGLLEEILGGHQLS